MILKIIFYPKKKKILKFFFSNFVRDNFDWKNSSLKKIFLEFTQKDENRTKENNKFDILQKILNKNLKIWSNYQKSMNIEIVYVLQPFSNWCKKDKSKRKMSYFFTEGSKIKIYEVFEKWIMIVI